MRNTTLKHITLTSAQSKIIQDSKETVVKISDRHFVRVYKNHAQKIAIHDDQNVLSAIYSEMFAQRLAQWLSSHGPTTGLSIIDCMPVSYNGMLIGTASTAQPSTMKEHQTAYSEQPKNIWAMVCALGWITGNPDTQNTENLLVHQPDLKRIRGARLNAAPQHTPTAVAIDWALSGYGIEAVHTAIETHDDKAKGLRAYHPEIFFETGNLQRENLFRQYDDLVFPNFVIDRSCRSQLLETLDAIHNIVRLQGAKHTTLLRNLPTKQTLKDAEKSSLIQYRHEIAATLSNIIKAAPQNDTLKTACNSIYQNLPKNRYGTPHLYTDFKDRFGMALATLTGLKPPFEAIAQDIQNVCGIDAKATDSSSLKTITTWYRNRFKHIQRAMHPTTLAIKKSQSDEKQATIQALRDQTNKPVIAQPHGFLTPQRPKRRNRSGGNTRRAHSLGRILFKPHAPTSILRSLEQVPCR